MEITAALQGRLDEFLEQQARGIQTGIRAAVEEGAKEIQAGWRAAVNQRFSRSGRVTGGNRRVANAIRLRVYENDDAGAAATVYSNFGRKDSSGKFVDYLLPHLTGETITPKGGRWLYIPLQKGRRAKRSRLAVSRAKNLAFVPLGPGRALLVRKTRTRSTPIALLVKRIRIEKGLNFDAVVRREQAALGGRLLKFLETV